MAKAVILPGILTISPGSMRWLMKVMHSSAVT